MHNFYKWVICTIFLVGLSVFFLVGCSDENLTIPAVSPAFTYATIWPAIEGNSWEFGLNNQISETEGMLYSTREEVPEVPTMDTLYADLKKDEWGTPSSVALGNWTFLFTENVSEIEGVTVLGVSNTTEVVQGNPRRPLPFWSGQFWTHSGDQISFSSAGDMTWLLLEGGLTPGNNFSAELSPRGWDSSLRSRVEALRSITVMGQEYSNCLECFYVLDGGIQVVTNENAGIEGYFRQYIYGIIVYVPEIGPVFCHERYMGAPGYWENRKVTLQALGSSLSVATNPSIHDFEFRIELREKTVVFETVHGTTWKGLSWAVGDDSPMEFWLDESGIAGRQEDLQGSQFLIHFRESESGAKMVSSGGTSWRELGFGCGEPGACNFMVNENGVKGL